MRRLARVELDPPDQSWRIPPQIQDERSGGHLGSSLEVHMKGLLFAVIVGIAAFYGATAAALFGMSG